MAAASRLLAGILRRVFLPAMLLLLLIGSGQAAAHEWSVTVAAAAGVQTAAADHSAADDHDACQQALPGSGHHGCPAGWSCQPLGLVQDTVVTPASAGRRLERQSGPVHGGRDIAPLFHPPKIA